tara:strand:- start:65 stop:340 length:276 start_codon:yes stop_codon:yes gene_type:complete
MLIRLTEVKQIYGKYTLKEVMINPKHVVCIRHAEEYQQMLQEGKMPEGLDTRQSFTRLYLDRGQQGIDVVVVGNTEIIAEKLSHGKKVLFG